MGQLTILKLKATEVLLLLYVLFIPLEAVIIFEGLGTLTRLIGYLLLAVFILEYKIMWRIVSKEAYLFILLLIASVAWSKKVDLVQTLRIIMFFSILIITLNTLWRNSRLLEYLIFIYSMSTFFVAITSFIGFLTLEERYTSIEKMGLAPVSLLFAVAFAFQLSNIEFKKRSVVNFILLFGNLLGILATGTRAAWLAVIIVSLIFVFNQNALSKILKRLILTLAVVSIFFLLFPPIFSFIDSRLGALIYDRGANRLLIWDVAWEMFKDKPFLGFGYRNFPVNFTIEYVNQANLSSIEYNILTFSGTGGLNRGSHNDYIGIAVELGLVGLIIFLSWVKGLVKNLKSLSHIYYGFLALLIMSFFQDNINQKIFWLLFGIMEYLKFTSANLNEMPEYGFESGIIRDNNPE